jgi:hypothetical protein
MLATTVILCYVVEDMIERPISTVGNCSHTRELNKCNLTMGQRKSTLVADTQLRHSEECVRTSSVHAPSALAPHPRQRRQGEQLAAEGGGAHTHCLFTSDHARAKESDRAPGPACIQPSQSQLMEAISDSASRYGVGR